MRLLAAIIVIAACNQEPSPPRADDGSSHLKAPVIVVTKSELSCNAVVEKLKAVVASYDKSIAALVGTKAPIVLSSCIYEGWPESLKECIVTQSADAIANHACDALVPDDVAQRLVDRLAPGRGLRASDFLVR